ncbi:MAG: type II secretion system F family protein [Holosporaceae bacterium]|jgi:tight adherence protein B|nr:type II secretion system F family protein [Holosporaceae bacterium]
MDSVIDNICISIVTFLIVHQILDWFEKSNLRKKIEAKANSLAKQLNKSLKSPGEKATDSPEAEQEEFWAPSIYQHGIIGKIGLTLERAGVTGVSIYSFIALFIFGGAFFLSVIVHFKWFDIITGVLVAIGVWTFLAYGILTYMINNRKMEFLKLFPDAIDMMIRGCKAGLNIVHIMRVVSEESREPVAGEFKIISQRFDMGVEHKKTLLAAAEKIDLEEFQFLVIALVLQMENGGALAEILQNLSGIVRRRLEFDLKLKAMSAEARMSAVIISALPFVFMGVMAIINPNHLEEFCAPGIGQILLKLAVTLFATGTFVMWKVTKIKV